jgi:DNA-binding CsgD family transcriptional regulator
MLAADITKPIHSCYLPLIYELSALRLLRPFWPSRTHYSRFPNDVDGVSIQVRTCSLDYGSLLAQHIAYLTHTGALRLPWRLEIVPHLAGSDSPTLALRSGGAATASREALEHDLLQLSRELAARVTRAARVHLFVLSGSSDLHGRHESLSGRERAVLDLFLAGLGVRSIAANLFISPHTVRNHLKKVFRKTGVRSQRELRELFAAI